MSNIRAGAVWRAAGCGLCLLGLASPGAAASQAAPQKPAPKRAVPFSALLENTGPINQVVGGLQFAEGAAGDGRGNVYLADVTAGRILRWSTAGRLSILRDGAAGPSGMCVAPNGDVVACERRGRKVSATDSGGFPRTLVETCQGRALNGPRCAWVDPKGGVYFTDPPAAQAERSEQGPANVYYLAPEAAEPVPVVGDLQHPGAIAGTPDGGFLYVSDIGGNKTWVFQIQPGGRLGERRLFANVPATGITLDERGNVYLMSATVRVYASSGAFLEEFRMPGTPSSAAFGGEDGHTLFVTVNVRTPVMGGPPGRFETQGGMCALRMKSGGAVTPRPSAPAP